MNQLAISGLKVNRLDMYNEVSLYQSNLVSVMSFFFIFRDSSHSKGSSTSRNLANFKSVLRLYFPLGSSLLA